jgi:hypothetical protein
LQTKILSCSKQTLLIHLSLQFKKVGKVWSARVGSHYRAVATPIESGFLWVWIGTHAEYDKLLA